MINHRMWGYPVFRPIHVEPCENGIWGIMFYPESMFSWNEATKRHERIRASERIEKDEKGNAF